MNITFLIGNGFDLNLGLETAYTNFYPYFHENASDDNLIKGWIQEEPKDWAYLESKLGQVTVKIDSKQINKFIESKAEMEGLLLDYLSEQQIASKLISTELEDEFIRSINQFGDLLPSEQRQTIRRIKSIHKEEEIKYQFISFNYTSSLDRIVSNCKKRNPINTHKDSSGNLKNEILGDVYHIHGTTSKGMVLGVNDAKQIGNRDLQSDTALLDCMVKSRLNNALAEGKAKIAEDIINSSSVIVIFGMSLGTTDKYWWEKIVRWLNHDNHRLIIYSYVEDPGSIQRLSTNNMRVRNNVLDDFFKKGKTDQSPQLIQRYKERTFVVFNHDLFRFNDIEKQKKTSTKNGNKRKGIK